MRIISVLALVGMSCVAPVYGASNASTKVGAQVSTELQKLVDNKERPLSSLVVIAVKDGKPVYQAGFGQRDLTNHLPADTKTLYRIASISKLITAIDAMRLVEEGKLDLDADVSKYLGFTLRNPTFPDQPISVRMLLSHTSSLRDPDDATRFNVGDTLAAELQTTATKHWDTNAKHGPEAKYFTYSNMNLIVAATVVECITGERFDRYSNRIVLNPLQIKGGFYPAEDFHGRDFEQFATLYRKSPDEGDTWPEGWGWVPQGPDHTGRQNPPIPHLDQYKIGSNAGIFSPQGGLHISAEGLLHLMQMFMNDGKYGDAQILKPATLDLMFSPQWQFNESATEPNGDPDQHTDFAWGLGPKIYTDHGGKPGYGDRIGSAAGGYKAVGHPGQAYGLLASILLNRETKEGYIYIIGGVATNPAKYPGEYSGFYGWEEKTLGQLYRIVHPTKGK